MNERKTTSRFGPLAILGACLALGGCISAGEGSWGSSNRGDPSVGSGRSEQSLGLENPGGYQEETFVIPPEDTMTAPMSISVTPVQLVLIAPGLTLKSAATWVTPLGMMLEKGEANTLERAAMFLAQVAHETCDFRYCEEVASGAAYEGRKDLGNILPGDGIKFKGRGLIQLTGRANYTKFAKYAVIDCVNHPEMVASINWSPIAAAYYWTTHNCNALADANDFNGVTRAINGGLNGLQSRLTHWKAAKTAFGLP